MKTLKCSCAMQQLLCVSQIKDSCGLCTEAAKILNPGFLTSKDMMRGQNPMKGLKHALKIHRFLYLPEDPRIRSQRLNFSMGGEKFVDIPANEEKFFDSQNQTWIKNRAEFSRMILDQFFSMSTHRDHNFFRAFHTFLEHGKSIKYFDKL